MYCNKCGQQIIDNSEFCSFCGSKISDDVTPLETSNPNREIKNKKHMIIIFSISAIIIITAFILMYTFLIKDQGYFRNTRWGMTFEEVENVETNQITRIGDTVFGEVTDALGFEGNTVLVGYNFDDNGKLTSASYAISAKVDDIINRGNAESVFEYASNIYSKKYGKPNDEYLQNGVLSWDTKNSTITMILLSNKNESAIMIRYEDIKSVS